MQRLHQPIFSCKWKASTVSKLFHANRTKINSGLLGYLPEKLTLLFIVHKDVFPAKLLVLTCVLYHLLAGERIKEPHIIQVFDKAAEQVISGSLILVITRLLKVLLIRIAVNKNVLVLATHLKFRKEQV